MPNNSSHDPIKMMGMPKLNILLTWTSTASGGAEKSVAELSNALHGQGHEVHLIAWEATDQAPPTDHTTPFPITRVKTFADYQAKLHQALHNGADIVISNHRTAYLDIQIAANYQAVVIPVLRATMFPQGTMRMISPDTGELIGGTPDTFDWDLLSQADSWVGISASSTRSIINSAPVPVRAVTIYNGISTSYRHLREPNRVRRLAVVARLEEWKAINLIIDAYASLPAWAIDRLVLDIYGEGPARDALAAQINRNGLSKHVTLRGYSNSWQDRADILVAASPVEAFGRSVIEAGAVGIPQIVPNTGGSSKLVLDEITGLRFDFDSPTGLTEAMARAAAWPEQTYLSYALAARAHALRFDIETCAAAYAALGADLLLERVAQPGIGS